AMEAAYPTIPLYAHPSDGQAFDLAHHQLRYKLILQMCIVGAPISVLYRLPQGAAMAATDDPPPAISDQLIGPYQKHGDNAVITILASSPSSDGRSTPNPIVIDIGGGFFLESDRRCHLPPLRLGG
ncbi:hypothetical protein ACLOJK_026901, partial [Asimina triloba]